MATIVSFHAHPDDESIHVGGTLAKLSGAGHRVVLVFATKGEHGEVADGFLDDDEHLAQRREQEVQQSAAILGAQRVEFLGYHDSGHSAAVAVSPIRRTASGTSGPVPMQGYARGPSLPTCAERHKLRLNRDVN